MPRKNTLIAAGLLLSAILAFSAIHASDLATWLMEVMPVLIAAPILVVTYRRFPLTSLLYGMIFCHALILIVGGTYTYARVPFGFWLQDWLSLSRNPYDKIGHFAQGLVPALVAREIFIRAGFVSGRRMAAFLAICVAMAISACYELIEWGAALALGQGADDFLGTQGDPWDTQSDMLFALIGASVAMLLLARWHDRQIAGVEARCGAAHAQPMHEPPAGSRPGAVQDFTLLLEQALAEIEAAGLGVAANESRTKCFAAYATSSEWLGEVGLAITGLLDAHGAAIPVPARAKLQSCLQEVAKVWPRFRRAG